MTDLDPSEPGQLPEIDLRGIFAGQEEVLVRELRASSLAGHPGVHGDGNEDLWIELLRKRLPSRYAISKAIVVDSVGGRSHQIDAVIHDRQYSPQVWERGEHKYVPAESVYAVFEIKPEINRDYVLYASRKVASVRRLSRTSSSFAWANGTHAGREDFVPLGGLLAGSCGWKTGLGDPLESALADAEDEGRLDLGCVLGEGAFEITDRSHPQVFTSGGADVALVTFLLTLLRRLQGLGTAPAIDYAAYARWIDHGSAGAR